MSSIARDLANVNRYNKPGRKRILKEAVAYILDLEHINKNIAKELNKAKAENRRIRNVNSSRT